MKKNFILILLVIFVLHLNANSFFLQNRLGILIKVDPVSAYKMNLPENKGPRLDEVPKILSSDKYEKELLPIIDYKDKALIERLYKKGQDGNYSVTINTDIFDSIIKVDKILRSYNITLYSYKKISIYTFEKSIFVKFTDEDKAYMLQYFKKSKNNMYYYLDINSQDIEDLSKLREFFLKYNKDNEIDNSLDRSGSPSPHNFTRVHNAKSKAYFDIHLSWGVKLDNNLTIGFAVNITNFTMFSLELINIKYNFNLPGYPFEPYIGGALYGGYLDGFPIGINLLGGFDVYPMSINQNSSYNNRNFYISGELRVGPVIYIPVYYDTGLNTETIYKKIGVLAEGGFYFNYGYLFNN